MDRADPTVRAVLWDLDGTLADSKEYHWRAWREAMGAEGVLISRADFEDSFGKRNAEILAGWLGPETDGERVQRIGDAKEALYRTLIEADGIEPLPGAAEWVRSLATDGWRQAVASSAPRLNVEVMCRALSLDAIFDAFVAAEDVGAGKPDPEVFLTAAARLGVPATRCVVVEDAAAGIEAARSAGMASVAVGLDGVPADLSVRSLADLAVDAFELLLSSRNGTDEDT